MNELDPKVGKNSNYDYFKLCLDLSMVSVQVLRVQFSTGLCTLLNAYIEMLILKLSKFDAVNYPGDSSFSVPSLLAQARLPVPTKTSGS